MPWNRRPSALRSPRALPSLAALLLLASGCASRGPAAAPVPDIETLWVRYEQAVAAAKYPQPANVSGDLVPIARYTPGLVWDASGEKVLMGTWTQAQHYPVALHQVGDVPSPLRSHPGKRAYSTPCLLVFQPNRPRPSL